MEIEREAQRNVWGASLFGRARVLDVDPESGRVQVMMGADPSEMGEAGPRSAWATPAAPQAGGFGWGDTVLVAGSSLDDLFIMAMIEPAPSSRVDCVDRAESADRSSGEGTDVEALHLDSGAHAEVVKAPGAESIRVFSEDGALLFEYDAQTRASRVDLPGDDVEFVARRGQIRFVAEKGIGFFSKAPIEMMSAKGLKLAAANAVEKTCSLLELGTRKIELKGEDFVASARRAELDIEKAEVRGRRFTTTVDKLKVIAKRSESIAETVVERAKNAYRTVSELNQLDAGRFRTRVKDLYQLRSKNAVVNARESVAIDAEKINLG